MALARGSGEDLRYIIETELGVTEPVTGDGETTLLRKTGDTMGLQRDTFESSEIRSDRGMSDMKSGNKQTSGNIDIELSNTNYDDFFKALLYEPVTTPFVLDGASIQNKTTQTTFSILKYFTSPAHYQLYNGMTPSSFTLNLAANAMVTGSFSFMGYNQAVSATDPWALDTAPTQPTPGGLFDSFTGNILENDLELGTVTSLTLNIDNNVDPAFVLFNDGVKELIDGKCNVNGTLSIFFEDAVIYEKFVNDTESKLAFTLEDKDNSDNGYTFDLPRIKYTSADMPVTDEGTVTVTMAFQALQDSTAGYTVKITKNVA